MKMTKPKKQKITPPLPGMTKIPDYYGTPEWDFLYGGAWIGLCQFLMTKAEARQAFKEDTGFDVVALLKRSPIERMIDDASGYGTRVMGAWCDWVTVNHWGEQK